MNEKIKFQTVESSTITVDNSVDTSKKYDINASAFFQGEEAKSVEKGTVKLKEILKASFAYYSDGQLSVNYLNMDNKEEMNIINTVICEFVDNVKASSPKPILNV